MLRILAIDYGERRVGLAVCDPTGTIVTPLETLVVRTEKTTIDAIADIAKNKEIGEIVIGLPRLGSGEEGEKAAKVRSFGEKLSGTTGIPCVYWDERFSTTTAKRMLVESEEHKRRRNKEKLDSLAASVILSDYMRSKTVR